MFGKSLLLFKQRFKASTSRANIYQDFPFFTVRYIKGGAAVDANAAQKEDLW